MKKSLAAIASVIAVTWASAAFAATPVPSADPAVVAATKQMLASMKLRDVMVASLKQADEQMPPSQSRLCHSCLRKSRRRHCHAQTLSALVMIRRFQSSDNVDDVARLRVAVPPLHEE